MTQKLRNYQVSPVEVFPFNYEMLMILGPVAPRGCLQPQLVVEVEVAGPGLVEYPPEGTLFCRHHDGNDKTRLRGSGRRCASFAQIDNLPLFQTLMNKREKLAKVLFCYSFVKLLTFPVTVKCYFAIELFSIFIKNKFFLLWSFTQYGK